jgi:hypothetical protein
VRSFALGLLLILPARTFATPEVYEPAAQREWRQQGEVLRNELRAMNARWVSGQLSSREVVLESERLRAGFDRLSADARDLTPADYALNRELASQSFSWLARAGSRFRADATVAQALMQTYGFIGDFYHGRFPYPNGAWFAYVDATRWARAVVLNNQRGSAFERDLERFALAWATVAYASGSFAFPSAPSADLLQSPRSAPLEPEPPRTDLKPVALPAIEQAKLDATQKAQWVEIQPRFRQVSASVYQARQLLEDLSHRLRQQQPNATLNVQDAATAIKMQGFLDDAAELVRAAQFEKAAEALERADYERGRLKRVTGQ